MVQAGVMARSHDELLPRSPGGFGAGALLALLAHALLIAGLTFAVDWRTREPEPVSAELWVNVPRALAPESAPPQSPLASPTPTPTAEPTPPPPPPEVPKPAPPVPAPPPAEAPKPPPEPDIATERAERRRVEAERKKAEAQAEATRQRELAEQRMEAARKQAVEKAQERAQERAQEEARKKAEADRKRLEQQAQEAADKRLAQQREENLKRMMGEAGKTTGTAGVGGAAAARRSTLSASESQAYADKLGALIRSNTIYTGNPPDNSVVVVEVRAAAGGTILGRRVLRSSGHLDWDEAVIRGIDRTASLPPPPDGRMPETIIIDFKPRGE